MDSFVFVIVFIFSRETLHSAALSLTNKPSLYLFQPMFRSRCDKAVHLQLYQRTTFFDTPQLRLSWLTRKIWLLGLNWASKINALARFGLVISGSGRVRASKWGPFTTLYHWPLRYTALRKGFFLFHSVHSWSKINNLARLPSVTNCEHCYFEVKHSFPGFWLLVGNANSCFCLVWMVWSARSGKVWVASDAISQFTYCLIILHFGL